MFILTELSMTQKTANGRSAHSLNFFLCYESGSRRFFPERSLYGKSAGSLPEQRLVVEPRQLLETNDYCVTAFTLTNATVQCETRKIYLKGRVSSQRNSNYSLCNKKKKKKTRNKKVCHQINQNNTNNYNKN